MSDQPIHPAIASVVRSLQEISLEEDPFCCGHEAASYAAGLLHELDEAGFVDHKWANAKTWINEFAERIGIDYPSEFVDNVDWWLSHPAHKMDLEDIDMEVFLAELSTFWDNYEIVTGTTVPPEKRTESFFAQTDEEE